MQVFEQCQLLLVELSVKVNVFVPVANLGFVLRFGFGIKKLPITSELKSLISLLLTIFAWGPRGSTS